MEISYTGDCGSIEVVLPYGPETREEQRKILAAELKGKFDLINTVGKQSDEHKNTSVRIKLLLLMLRSF